MEILIDGNAIKTEREFHRAFSLALGIESIYGENLHALWDVLSANVKRPVILTWKNSEKSRQLLGSDFDSIIDVLQRVEIQDKKFGWTEKFSFFLE